MIEKDNEIIKHFENRDGKKTIVKLKSGKLLNVWNIAWGYDIEDEYAHITSNVTPSIENASIDFFYTNEISELIDPENGGIFYK